MWQVMRNVGYHVVVILRFELVSHDECFTTNLELVIKIKVIHLVICTLIPEVFPDFSLHERAAKKKEKEIKKNLWDPRETSM